MIKTSRTGWRRIWDATRYSMNGIKAAWRNEAAFRQELAVVLVMLPASWWVGATMTQRALLVFSLLLVLIVELLNSAIEATIDRLGTERNELSGRAKDLGSAAVMVSLIAAAAVWGFAVWEKLKL
ncbi:MAG: diacylglycerol kinase [Desulfobacteraceae bacterium]